MYCCFALQMLILTVGELQIRPNENCKFARTAIVPFCRICNSAVVSISICNAKSDESALQMLTFIAGELQIRPNRELYIRPNIRPITGAENNSSVKVRR